MKLANTIEKQQKKKNTQKKRRKIVQKVVYTLLGIPYLAIEKKVVNAQKRKWLKDIEKSKQKVVKELVDYIEKELAIERITSYFIYNEYRHEDIDYGNAFHLKETLSSFGGKYFKQGRLFNRYVMQNKSSEKEDYYAYFYDEIEKYFRNFEDVEVVRDTEKKWTREYEYIKIILKEKTIN